MLVPYGPTLIKNPGQFQVPGVSAPTLLEPGTGLGPEKIIDLWPQCCSAGHGSRTSGLRPACFILITAVTGLTGYHLPDIQQLI